MRFLTALALGLVLACSPPSRPEPAPEATLDIPPLDAGAPIATTTSSEPPPTAPPADADSDDLTKARDPLASRPARPPGLVTVEVQQLQALLSATPTGGKNNLQRAMILKRLADGKFALARGRTDAHARDLRTEAMAHDSEIATTQPSFPNLDEVLYYRGLAAELNHSLAEARRSYFDLIQKRPTSKYVPYAYFAFAEMFRAEGQSDPSKLPLALQGYKQVLKYPPPQNEVYPYAQKRIDELKAAGLSSP